MFYNIVCTVYNILYAFAPSLIKLLSIIICCCTRIIISCHMSYPHFKNKFVYILTPPVSLGSVGGVVYRSLYMLFN